MNPPACSAVTSGTLLNALMLGIPADYDFTTAWLLFLNFLYSSVSQPPGTDINYTGPQEILLELIANLNVILYLSTCHTVHITVLIFFVIMP